MTGTRSGLDSIERVSTGIEGLDDVLGGGFPRNHLYLIEGEAGAGKTTVGLHFLLDGQKKGERTLWITMSETERELRSTARSHGWSLEGVEICNLVVSDEMFRAEGKYSFFSPADVELNDTTKSVLDAVNRVKPHRIVFDPFSDIKLLSRDPLRYRRQVLALREFLAERECTAVLMQEMTRGMPGDVQAEALVHGYLTLHQDSPEYGGQRRRLRIHKMRGIPFRDGYHDFSIVTGGVRVYPRLVAAEHATDDQPEEVVLSGLKELDNLVGGGMERGSSLLVMGPAGVGKSTLATQYAVAAARRGEKVALFIFDETIRAFRNRSRKLGMPVDEFIESGVLQLTQIDSAQFSPGQFTHAVRKRAEDGVGIIVIDSLSGYLSAMPEERFLSTHIHELLTFLSHRNVLTILTLAQHGVVGERVESPVDISYLADSVLVLRYFEAFGAVRRAVSVVKKRSGKHEVFIREMSISEDGLHVGKPLEEFAGVLTGRLQYSGNVAGLRQNAGSSWQA